MCVRSLSLTLALLQLLPGLSDALGPQTECRVCPERCLTVPREGSGCPICICDGVAKEDCIKPTCQVGCREELDAEGCKECICDPICPAAPLCPEGCEQKLNSDGCIICDCGDNNNICEAVPACPKGCIEMRMDTKCFSCNCTIPENPLLGPGAPFNLGGFEGTPFKATPFGVTLFGGSSIESDEGNRFGGGFNIFNKGNRRRPIASSSNLPFGGIPNQPFDGLPDLPPVSNSASGALICPDVQCPKDCRIAINDSGCRECLCGEDAFMCPGVAACFGRCVNTDQETSCCSCTCIRETELAISGGGSFGPALVLSGNGFNAIIFNGQRRPVLRPGRRPVQIPVQGPRPRPSPKPEERPVITNEEDAEGFSPENTDNKPESPEPNLPDPADPNDNGYNPPVNKPVDPNPDNPGDNGYNPPAEDPVIPNTPAPTTPALTTPVPTTPAPTTPAPTDPPVNNGSPADDCPKIGEVECVGGCEPRAGPDGCPVCDCGQMRMREEKRPMKTQNA